MGGELKPYPDYKPSGVEWLGDVPVHWEVQRLKNWLGINELVLSEDTDPEYTFAYVDIGSVEAGRLNRIPERMQFGHSPSRARRVIRSGDTIVSTVRTYLKAVWHVEGTSGDLIASTGFAVLTPGPRTHPKFVNYFCQSDPFTNGVTAESVGIAYPAIADTRLAAIKASVPPPSEQAAIARFLDHTDQHIRRYIRAKEKLVALLQEYQQVLVSDAVTGRIDIRTGKPYPAYKPSGIKWIKEVPAHWEVRAAKWCFQEADDRSITGSEELLSVSHVTGVTPRREKQNVTMFKAESNIGHKRCEPGDMVVNTMWAWMAALGIAGQAGIVSPSYAVYRPRLSSGLTAEYAERLLRTTTYRNEFVCRSMGIRSSRLRLYPEDFLRIRLLCPPPEEQAAIVRFLDRMTGNLQKRRTQLQMEIELLREYRTRLIADVVTGKLDVRAVAMTLPEISSNASDNSLDDKSVASRRLAPVREEVRHGCDDSEGRANHHHDHCEPLAHR